MQGESLASSTQFLITSCPEDHTRLHLYQQPIPHDGTLPECWPAESLQELALLITALTAAMRLDASLRKLIEGVPPETF